MVMRVCLGSYFLFCCSRGDQQVSLSAIEREVFRDSIGVAVSSMRVALRKAAHAHAHTTVQTFTSSQLPNDDDDVTHITKFMLHTHLTQIPTHT